MQSPRVMDARSVTSRPFLPITRSRRATIPPDEHTPHARGAGPASHLHRQIE